MAALVVAVNPSVRFSDEQIAAILDEVFYTYGEFIDNGGLTMDGLRRTYDDGAGDVDRDFDALGLRLPDEMEGPGAYERRAGKEAAPAAVVVGSRGGLNFGQGTGEPEELSDYTKQLIAELEELLSQKPAGTDPVSIQEHEAAVAKALAELRHRADTAKSPDEAFEAHMEMGHVLSVHGRHEEAMLSYRRAITLRPESARAHFRIGNVCYNMYKYSEARDAYERALAVARTPGDSALLPKIHVNLGIALEATGMLMNACEHYREAAILNPSHFRALKLLGSALYGLGELRAAEEALEHALHLQPDFADAQSDLGCCLRELGDVEGAMKHLRRATDVDSSHVQAHYNLANLHRQTGDFSAAIASYDSVLRHDPLNWKAMLNKASALLAAGRGQEARQFIKMAFEITERVELYDYQKQLNKMTQSAGRKNTGLTKKLAPVGDKFNAETAEALAGTGATFTREKGRTARADAKLFSMLPHKLKPKKATRTLDVPMLQTLVPMHLCPVNLMRKEATDANLPPSAEAKVVRKAVVEKVMRRAVDAPDALVFAGMMKTINQRVLSVLTFDSAVRGQVDLGMFLACMAALCEGHADDRKKAVFEVLLWRSGRSDDMVPYADVQLYIRALHAVYRPLPGGEAPKPLMPSRPGDVVDPSQIKLQPMTTSSSSEGEEEYNKIASQDLVKFKEFDTLIDNKRYGFHYFSGLPYVTRRKGFNVFSPEVPSDPTTTCGVFPPKGSPPLKA